MYEAVKNPCLVPFNGDYDSLQAKTLIETVTDKKAYKKRLEKLVEEIMVESLKHLNFQYPEVSKSQLEDAKTMRELLEKPR
ncbi:hypothetical protein ACFL1J_04910 [Pseudomonadota bacterium]|jgi:hypothetical protein